MRRARARLGGHMWQHVAGGEGEREYLPLDELEGAEVSVAAAPLESALVTTIATLRARRDIGALRRRDVEALRPLVDYRTRAWPSCLTRATGEHDFAADVAAGVRVDRCRKCKRVTRDMTSIATAEIDTRTRSACGGQTGSADEQCSEDSGYGRARGADIV